MAFTYDVTTSRGKVRLLCRDTVETGARFTDDEIDAFISLGGTDVWLGAAFACRALQARGVRLATGITVGGFRLDGTQADGYDKLAAFYEQQAYSRAGIDFIDMMGSDAFGYSELEVLKSLRGEDD